MRDRFIAPVRPISPATAERLAAIVGEASGADAAIAEWRRRRAAGETVRLWRRGTSVFVDEVTPEADASTAADIC